MNYINLTRTIVFCAFTISFFAATSTPTINATIIIQHEQLLKEIDRILRSSTTQSCNTSTTQPCCFTRYKHLFYITTVSAILYWSFCLLKGKLAKCKTKLAQADLWSSWQLDLSLHDLLSLPQQTLTDWLIKDIKERYPHDNSTALFYDAIQIEQKELEDIAYWYDICFYIIDSAARTDVHHRIELLEHLKQLVFMWEIEGNEA